MSAHAPRYVALSLSRSINPHLRHEQVAQSLQEWHAAAKENAQAEQDTTRLERYEAYAPFIIASLYATDNRPG